MNPADLSELLKQSPFIAFLGLEVTAWDVDSQTLRLAMPFKSEFERAAGSGQAHGGVLASLLDTATTLSVMAAHGKPVPTVDLRIDYLRAATGTRLLASATVRRLGAKLATADAECCDESGRLLAVARGTFLVS